MILYIPVFLTLKRVITVEGSGLNCRIRRTTPEERQIVPEVDPRRMLLYVALLTLSVTPLSMAPPSSYPAVCIVTVNFSTVQHCFRVSLICGDRCFQLVSSEFTNSFPLRSLSPQASLAVPSFPFLDFSTSWSIQSPDLAFCDHLPPRRMHGHSGRTNRTVLPLQCGVNQSRPGLA